MTKKLYGFIPGHLRKKSSTVRRVAIEVRWRKEKIQNDANDANAFFAMHKDKDNSSKEDRDKSLSF